MAAVIKGSAVRMYGPAQLSSTVTAATGLTRGTHLPRPILHARRLEYLRPLPGIVCAFTAAMDPNQTTRHCLLIFAASPMFAGRSTAHVPRHRPSGASRHWPIHSEAF